VAKQKPRNLVVVSDTHAGSGSMAPVCVERQACAVQLNYRSLGAAQSPRPCIGAKSLSPERNAMSARRVLSLFNHRRPTAVAWFVVAVVVFALKGVSIGWPMAHIRQELREGLAPLSANLDTPAAVPRIKVSSLVLASGDHAFPDPVLWRPAEPMRAVGSRARVHVQASATSDVSALKGSCGDDCVAAAVTQAQPMDFLVSSPDRSYDGESFKSLTGDVYA
jgi:hypothetical protein